MYLLLYMTFTGISSLLAQSLSVYPPVDGLAQSEYYSFRIRQVGSSSWLTPFAWITRCVESTPENDDSKYYSQWIGSWSNTYINFEMANSTQVEIEITKIDGSDITKAVAHPQDKVISCSVSGGKAYVVIDDPALFTVDINGQMDDQNTGRQTASGWGDDALYSGDPIHTLTIFANPFTDKPSTSDPNVYTVSPGDTPPETGSWNTLYFMPGVHNIGHDFHVHANKNYYISGDAMVYGTFNNDDNWDDGHDIRIYGHGTLSGAGTPHPEDDGAADDDYFRYRPIDIRGARNTTFEGITIADSPYHTLMLINTYDPENPSYVRWTKIFTWRSNGDGINPFGNVDIEDCFIRTQDDCVYTNGLGMRRVVFWNDVNGSSFVLSPVGRIDNPDLVIEDCDIIYSRSFFQPGGRGGCMFNLRGDGGGEENGHKLTFRNIRGEDTRPTRAAFNMRTAHENNLREAPGHVTNIVFENINIAGSSILGDLETIIGYEVGPLHDIVFDNVVIADELIDNINDFYHNEYVYDLVFLPIQSNLITNGDFATGDLTGWNFAAVSPSVATGSVAAGECFVDITNDGGTDLNIKLAQENLSLENDSTYTASFDANAESARTLILQIKSSSGTVFLQTFNISAVMKKYQVTFKNELSTANDFEFQFFLGSQGNNNVWIDNVGLTTSLPRYMLTTSVTNGSLKVNPLRDTYTSGTIITLSATGDLGYVFNSWGGDLSGSDNPAKIIMEADKTVTASFTEAPIYTLTTSATGGSISFDPEGPQYTEGTVVNLDAKANAGYVFAGWSGDPLNQAFYINPNYITMNGDKSITVNFLNITGIDNEDEVLPKQTQLAQNFPNPFNPSTSIKFQLPMSTHVKLFVYNTLGQLVENLVDKELDAGYHSINFNASSLSSGIYIYRIEAGDYIKIKKMMLLK